MSTKVAPIEKKGILTFSASKVAWAHSVFAYQAFIAALIVGCYLHYEKIVENASYGYPDEWFPSVSATIGDRYPERSIFQILIAVTSGPRFLLIFFNFVRLFRSHSIVPYIALGSGLLRTFTCGGWVYITSTDDHDWHDIFMISYIVLTIPWEVTVIILSDKGSLQKKGRLLTSLSFFGMLVPLVYYFIQHKVHVVAGAYSIYAYFEWGLIFLDVAFDTWSVVDLREIEISISSNGISFAKKPLKQTTPAKVAPINDEFCTIQTVANVINAFMFWSIATSLFLCLWYFPLWDMGISGYEATIVAFFLAPVVLFVCILKRFYTRFPFITRALAVILGLGAYRVEEPEHKLLTITAGLAFGVISQVVETSALQNQTKKYNSHFLSLIIGLLASSVAKFYWYSNNPVWPVMNKTNGGLNEAGILVGLLGAFFTPSLTNSKAEDSIKGRTGGSLILASLGVGGYIFNLFTFLSDSSTLTFWTWDGFPIVGPTPLVASMAHLGALMLGILAAVKFNPNSFSSVFYNVVFGAGSAAALYLFPGWIGFAGTTVYTFYLATISPVIGQSVVGYDSRIVYILGYFWFDILALGGVWTVAYAFVPGGPLLRERSDLILGGSLLLIFGGVLNYKLRNKASNISRLNLGTKSLWRNTTIVLAVLSAVSISTFIRRIPDLPTAPYNEQSRSFTTGIWCVHFGIDNDMWSSENRMRDLIRDAEVDIIGLLETDTQRLIGGNRDFTQKIAEDLGMYVDYGPGPSKHTWGAALLSKFPIISSTHHLLPSPVGELAPAIHATLDIYGELIDVVVFHSGQEEDVEDRRLQSLALQEIMGNSSRPLVLLSYLVTEPGVGNYNTYVSEKSRMHDIDSTDWDRWCEYILFRELKKVAYARISRSTITDTELQIAKFKLLSEEERAHIDEELLYGNNFVHEEEIDEELRMPQMFRGDGVRGHFYHVFDEPRYFAQSREQGQNEQESGESQEPQEEFQESHEFQEAHD